MQLVDLQIKQRLEARDLNACFVMAPASDAGAEDSAEEAKTGMRSLSWIQKTLSAGKFPSCK